MKDPKIFLLSSSVSERKKNINILTIYVLFLFYGCSSSLSSDKIYEVSVTQFNLKSEIVDSETNNKGTLTKAAVKPFKFYFQFDDVGKARAILYSDKNTYVIDGSYDFFESNSIMDESYQFYFNSGQGLFMFTLNPNRKSINITAPEHEPSLTLSYSKSELKQEEFNEFRQKGEDNEYYPFRPLGKQIDSDEISDFWLAYFGLEDIIASREKLRKDLEEKRLAEEKREKEKRDLLDFKTKLCDKIKNYDLNNYLNVFDPYPVESRTIQKIEMARKGMKGEPRRQWMNEFVDTVWYYTPANVPIKEIEIDGIGQVPATLRSYGFITEEGVVKMKNGQTYVGPFTLSKRGAYRSRFYSKRRGRDGLFIGIWGYHGIYGGLDVVNKKDLEKYFVSGCELKE